MKKFPTSSLQSFDRNPSMKLRQIPMEMFLFSLIAMLFFCQAALPVFGQTTYTWTGGNPGTPTNSWTATGPSNWTATSGTGTTFPSASSDTAVLGDTTAKRVVLLNASESISALNMTEVSGVSNELVIGSTATTNLTLATALSLSSSSGSVRIYMDNLDSTTTGLPELTDNAGISVGTNGYLELGSETLNANVASSAGVTINSGGTLDVDIGITGGTTSASTLITSAYVTGPLTIASGGNLVMGSTNSLGTPSTGSYFDTRLGIKGNFVDNGTLTVTTGTDLSNELYFLAGTSATFTSSATNVNLLNGVIWNGTGNYTLSSDVNLPIVTMRPTTLGADTLTLGTVTAGQTLSIAGLSIYEVANVSDVVSLGSNLTLGSAITSGHTYNGTVFTLNANNYTLDYTGVGIFQTYALSNCNWTLEGSGGTIKANNFNLTGTTGAANTTYSTTVGSGLTLLAVGGTGLTNNLGNATSTSSIAPTSTFEYAGTATTAAAGSENFLTSNLTIGNLQVGTGSGTPILGISTATLTVGGNIAVNTGAILDLDGQNVTESHGTGATAGGLSGAGTIYNNATGTASVLTLDVTQGSGTFSGIIENNTAGSGTVALAVTGSGTNTQTLTGANTYTGSTTVTGGTLIVGTGGSIKNTPSIHVTGGSLLFNQGATFTTPPTVMAGGTSSAPAVLGFTSSATGGNTIQFGALSLIASSVTAIDFGSSNINTIIFNQGVAAIGLTGTTVLDIYHYVTGDVVEFSGSTTPNAADNVAQVQFFSGAVGSSTSVGFGQAVVFGGGFEVVPSTPEPSTIVVGLCFLGLLLRGHFAFRIKGERAPAFTSVA